jgi:PhzF family phenazine biosynthesis protein
MPEFPLYQLDAFTLGRDRPFSGNPAAVCPLDHWLDEGLMQAIAAENNLSETAFCVPSGERFGLRWFTPKVEVPICGHATLATAYVLFDKAPSRITIGFETKSGLLTVTKSGGLLSMDFPVLATEPCAISDALVAALGAAPVSCRQGPTDYMAIFGAAGDIMDLSPDFAAITALDRPGLIVTAPGKDCDFVSRYFAPAKGVNEDPVTGRAHCVLAPYWAERLGKNALQACQVSRRGGAVGCVVAGDRVQLSGRVAPYLEGTIRI